VHTRRLVAYVGHANGDVVKFTKGLRVFLSGDTALIGDVRTIVHGVSGC
jgi:hypothetical protein